MADDKRSREDYARERFTDGDNFKIVGRESSDDPKFLARQVEYLKDATRGRARRALTEGDLETVRGILRAEGLL